ncbi:hypothetical protein BH23ACT11_BH23ACT11_27150 [soil metagenome]
MYRRRRIGAAIVIAVLLLALALLAGVLLFAMADSNSEGASEPGLTQDVELSRNASERVNGSGGNELGVGEPAVMEGSGASQVSPLSGDKSGDSVVINSGAVRPSEAARGEFDEFGAEPLDILVLGVDQRPAGSSVEGSRADAIMIVRLFRETGHVKLLSVPRDLFVEIEPGVEDRINAAYAYGGVEQLSRAVQRTTGISSDRYAVVDFDGFQDIVNAVGGIKLKIDGEMPPGRRMEGTETLDGEQALFYARYRGTPGGDLDRIKRQQQVVGALREKLINWGSVSKLPGIMEAVHRNLETDLGFVANLSLARSLMNAEDPDAAFNTVQLAGEPSTLSDGRQVLVPDGAENEEILQEFRGE